MRKTYGAAADSVSMGSAGSETGTVDFLLLRALGEATGAATVSSTGEAVFLTVLERGDLGAAAGVSFFGEAALVRIGAASGVTSSSVEDAKRREID